MQRPRSYAKASGEPKIPHFFCRPHLSTQPSIVKLKPERLLTMPPSYSYEVDVPESYSSLPLEHIKVANHPEDAPGVTPVIVVTLHRPEQRNAFTARMMEDLELVYPKFDVDERVKCIVLTGAGDSFCAGADLQMGFGALGRTERLNDNRDT